MIQVRVQLQDFDIGAEIAALRAGKADIGAIASFVGLVRDFNDGSGVTGMTLEHYPGMTERALERIAGHAMQRWTLIDCLVVHRYGVLQPMDQIVLVAVTATHRGPAFAACEYVMDYLKTEAPFWKRESTPQGSRWVDARESDEAARQRWRPPGDIAET